MSRVFHEDKQKGEVEEGSDEDIGGGMGDIAAVRDVRRKRRSDLVGR